MECDNPAVLRIPHPYYHSIRHHGGKAYPHECCGILLGLREGAVRTVSEVISCDNAHTESPQVRYVISPAQLIAAQKSARDSGLEIIGFYHSHPDSEPRWSVTDLEEAHWDDCSYLILGVDKGDPMRANCFLLRVRAEGKFFEAEELEVIEDINE